VSVTLHRWRNRDGQEWACAAYDHGPLCRRCQPVDDVMAALLDNVEMGRMEIVGTDGAGDFRFRVTDLGLQHVKGMIEEAWQ
jgi:hypothetical protein